MLKFQSMKKALAVMARFCTVSLVFELVYVFSLVLSASMRPVNARLLDVIIAGALSTVLLAVTAGCFSAFFTLNRLYSSRIAGYLTAFLLAFIPLGAAAFGLRLMPDLQQLFTVLDLGFFPGFHTLMLWYADISSNSWTILSLGTASFALFLASFWGLTRLFGKRPLMGALLMPACFVFAIYTYSVFLSGPVDAVFSYIGLSLAKPLAAAAIAALVSCALFMADLIMARPPDGRRQNG
ncbi:MAG: hypothetical protein ABIJ86_07320 [Spirochaetota bacterium]